MDSIIKYTQHWNRWILDSWENMLGSLFGGTVRISMILLSGKADSRGYLIDPSLHHHLISSQIKNKEGQKCSWGDSRTNDTTVEGEIIVILWLQSDKKRRPVQSLPVGPGKKEVIGVVVWSVVTKAADM